MSELSLIVRRTIAASAARLFAAWTDPAQLPKWWGPRGVRCSRAEVDLRVGGSYRIANEMPDGSVLWIVGSFERIVPPTELAYTWRLESGDGPGEGPAERVTVRFVEGDGTTEVIVVHERIADDAARERHEHGWVGCLDGLTEYVSV
jgi:uncharacterized protein YndB with AHSA1/START domain